MNLILNQRKVILKEAASDLQVDMPGTVQREKDEAVDQGNKTEISSENMISDSQDYLFYDVSSQ